MARSFPGAVRTRRPGPFCRWPGHRGPSEGPLLTPRGILSGCFRSSKFTQSSHLSCRKKSLWPGTRVRSGGSATCEPQSWGLLSAPLPLPLGAGVLQKARKGEAGEEGAVMGGKTPAPRGSVCSLVFTAFFPLLVHDSLGDPRKPPALSEPQLPHLRKGGVESS